MANQIRLKRASGSDPSASDLVTGELAVRTDTAKLFTKKDDNSVAEIGGTTIADGSITEAKLATNSVTRNKISDGEVINSKLDSSAVTTSKINNGAVTNDKVSNSAAIAGTKISPDFGSQNVVTTGTLGSSDLTITSAAPALLFTETNGDPDFKIQCNGGAFNITDTTNSETRLRINAAGKVGIGTTSPASILDVTGDITVSGTVDGRDVASDGTKLDGIASGATNVTNNNQLTNGAGYITSADGGNAATLGSIGPGQFMRDDQNQTATGLITLTTGLSLGADARCAAAVSTLSDGSTITVDFTAGIHHSVTLGGNRTFGNPSNDASAVGQSGSIFITQDGTGSRTASFHGDYKFPGGTAPTLSTAANAVDRLDYVIKASGVIHCVVTLDVK
tara:strand:- start:314 stop:1489 length:1176 start_codon:yes stop_codon:yes gene_type:complete